MSQRINEAFRNKAKIAYLTAGDGGELSVDYFLSLAKGGVNILEIGVPFSDPVADGVVIQKAMERSLKIGTNVDTVLNIVRQVRTKTEVAIILFTYYNQIQLDLFKFMHDAKQAGVDGVLVVDLPYEESDELLFLGRRFAIAIIFVASPSTPLDRVALLSNKGSGFLYYACRKGTTGVRNELAFDIQQAIKQVKAYSSLPVAVGFGVSSNDMVKKIFDVSDGCVIGSYFVNAIANNISPNELEILSHKIFLSGIKNDNNSR